MKKLEKAEIGMVVFYKKEQNKTGFVQGRITKLGKNKYNEPLAEITTVYPFSCNSFSKWCKVENLMESVK